MHQSQYLINPSQPQVAFLLDSIGCHAVPMQTPACAWNVLNTLVDFQSQTHSFPAPSPDST